MTEGKVGIIDWRNDRRVEMRDWITEQGFVVKDADNRNAFNSLGGLDLLLLHVGDAQRKEGDDLEAIISEAIMSSWVVGYSGTQGAIKKFQQTSASEFAMYPEAVSADILDDDFKVVLGKVLRKLPLRQAMASNWLREAVDDFKPELERKLEVLISVLRRKQPSTESLKATGANIPAEALDLSNPRRSSELLRKAFFGS